jgi:hypothetical protein
VDRFRFSKAESYEKTLRIIISQEKDFFPQGEGRLKMILSQENAFFLKEEGKGGYILEQPSLEQNGSPQFRKKKILPTREREVLHF